MRRDEQIELLRKLLAYVDTKATFMAEAPCRNAVSIYTDTEQAARERQALFREFPLLMGFSSEWASPGAFRAEDHAGVPILIVRGLDGTLRAFLNVCRHRGAKIAQGCGEARRFTCPYHAWTYDLSGRIRGIPDERAFPGVRDERPSLVPLPVCEKHGLVWVIPSAVPSAATTFDIDPWLGGLASELATYGFVAGWSFFDRRIVREEMNWKLLVDTFNEAYHVGFLHRDSLSDILHGDIADFETFGLNHRIVIPRKKLEHLKGQPEQNWDLMWNTTIVYMLFPNTVLLVQGDHVELARIFPGERVDRAVMDLALYIPNAPRTDDERAHWDKNMDLIFDVVTGEDFPAGRTIQSGFASGAQTHVVYGRNEPGMIHYHRSLRTALQEPSDKADTDKPLFSSALEQM